MTTQDLSSAPAISTQRSARITLWHISLALVVMGLIVSGYLSYVKLTDVPMVCAQDSVFNCDVVQNSVYSKMFNIPIAWLGFGLYVVIGALLLVNDRSAFLRENGMLILFGLVLFGWVYSMYLVYLQFFVLRALCMWCLMHEAIISVLFLVTAVRLRNFLSA